MHALDVRLTPTPLVSSQTPESDFLPEDSRVSFDKAVSSFTDWLCREGHSDSLLWLTADRITGHGREFWLYRPETMTSSEASRRFYEAARATSSSLRLDMFCSWKGHSVVYVEDFGGDSRSLAFGISTSDSVVHSVNSPLRWLYHRAICCVSGVSPILRETSITPAQA